MSTMQARPPESDRKKEICTYLHGGELPSMAEWSREQLDDAFAFGFVLVERTVIFLAAILNEKRRRGLPFPKATGGLERAIVLIADGLLDPSAFVKLQGRLSIIKAIAGVPLAMQREIADGKLIEYVDPADRSVAMLPVTDIPLAYLGRVFVDGEIKDAAAQKRRIRNEIAPPLPPPQKSHVQFDAADQNFKFSGRVTPKLDVDRAVAETVGPFVPPADDDPAELESLPFLPRGGRVKLEEHCRKVGMSPAKYVLLCLHNAGFVVRP